jgi:hypothetical protein
MSKIEQMISELNQVLHSDTYQFEIDTEDFVFGFKNTIKKRTKSLAKAIKLKVMLTNDCGRFLSDTVRIVAVRFYKNGQLTKELKAEEITAAYNG